MGAGVGSRAEPLLLRNRDREPPLGHTHLRLFAVAPIETALVREHAEPRSPAHAPGLHFDPLAGPQGSATGPPSPASAGPAIASSRIAHRGVKVGVARMGATISPLPGLAGFACPGHLC